MPSFLLQPLVENAIKHGMGTRAGRGKIAIAARRDVDELALTIRDNGPGPSPEALASTSAGVGLRNTRRRLEALYPGAHTFELVTAAGGGGEVRIRIPLALAEPAVPPEKDAAADELPEAVSRAS